MATRKRYTAEYRHQATRLVIDTDRTIAEVARELSVGAGL
ncbi:transposase [Corynebacterium auriscanis]